MRWVSLAYLVTSTILIADAKASDWDDFLKAPPSLPDLTWHGITLYGAVDISAQYENNGAPYGGATYTSASLLTPANRGPQFLLATNQSAQSFVGIKIDEPIVSDRTHLIAKLESGYDSTTGELSDTLKSVQRANGIPLNMQFLSGDGPRAGTVLNGEAWGGFADRILGEIHVGRNSSIATDLAFLYDPLASYGFSLFGYVGILGGNGSSEAVRVDDSVKYLKSIGSFRLEAMYAQPKTQVDHFYQVSLGYDRPSFSADVLFGHATDLVSISSLAGSDYLNSPFLGARVSDTTMYGVMGKYIFELDGHGWQDPGQRRFTLSALYSRIDYSNPSNGGLLPGHDTIGGYELGPVLSPSGSSAAGIVNYAYTGGDRLLNIYMIAGKYQWSAQWSAAVAYYRYAQGTFGLGVNAVVPAPTFSTAKCNTSSYVNCAGYEQVASFRVDYDWTKNIRIYGGMAYSNVSGGFAFSYLKTYEYDPTVGIRVTF